MNHGYVSIHRKIRDHWIYQKPEYLKAFLDIVLEVNFKDTTVLIEGEIIECKRGQKLYSLDSWAKVFGSGWTKQKVRTFFNLLKKDKIINTEGMRKTTRLTVVNYDTYQNWQHGDDTGDNTETTQRQHGDNTETTPIEKRIIKNNNENNEKTKRFSPPTLEQVQSYCVERNNFVDPESFINFYESKNWMVGKNKMKCWKASVRTWEKNNYGNNSGNNRGYGNARITRTGTGAFA